MLIEGLKLHHFRLFEENVFHFEPGINWIAGANAKGKSTLLESIYLLITGRSFRTVRWEDLIQREKSYFRVEGVIDKNNVNQSITLFYNLAEKIVMQNQVRLSTLNALLGGLQGVLMAPQDVELIRGGPNFRRHYLDLQMAQVDPLYVHHLLRYSKALKERNFLLKLKKLQAMDVYEEILVQSASYLIQKRGALLNRIEPRLKKNYQSLANTEVDLTLKYISIEPHEFLRKLQSSRKREMELGNTLYGPHRDDVKVMLNHQEARHFASEGESRSLSAAFRLAEWEEMKEISGQLPLLLVDDFGMSLDSKRRANLWGLFGQAKQVIISCAQELSELSQNLRVNKIEL